MAYKVLKFGGSSVASFKEITRVASIIKHLDGPDQVAVVVSAMKGVTDSLEECAQAAESGDDDYLTIISNLELKHLDTIRNLIPVKNQSGIITQVKIWLNQLEDICRGVFLIGELSSKTMDYIYCHGELMSAFILAHILKHLDVDARFVDSRELIKTDDTFGKANVDFETTYELINNIIPKEESIAVLPGFIASTNEGEPITLGRGGSDYTAALLAGALNARELILWTDVEGVFTADPRIVKKAKPVRTITYEEAMELAHFGAKVIYPPTMQPVMERDIPIHIKNTFKPDEPGTIIKSSESITEQKVRGISGLGNISLLTLSGSSMIGVPGVAARLFKALADNDINIILITQASSEHTITVGVMQNEITRAVKAVKKEFQYEITLHKINHPVVEKSLSIISLVGDGMKQQTGIAGELFSSLGKANINIVAIAQGSSERNISLVVRSEDEQQAIITLHNSFFN